MNPYLAVAALVSTSGVLLALPLVPAFVELLRKSDAAPLNVVQQHGGDIRHFANSFRSYIKDLEPILQQCAEQGSTATGVLPDGAEYVVLARADEPLMRALQQRDAVRPVVIVAGVDLAVPPSTTLSRDIYTHGHFVGGENNRYRAILSERDVHLGQASQITRWVHAAGNFKADAECKLDGRISSDNTIRLQPSCSFQRLNAPNIQIGAVTAKCETAIENFSDRVAARRTLYPHDFHIPANEYVRGNLVVRGRLSIGAGARVSGSVKSDRDMVLEKGVRIEGSLISGTKLRIGQNCFVHGPVVAERSLEIESGTQCGTAEKPTTVSSPNIKVEEGVLVCGTLWAREQGRAVVRL